MHGNCARLLRAQKHNRKILHICLTSISVAASLSQIGPVFGSIKSFTMLQKRFISPQAGPYDFLLVLANFKYIRAGLTRTEYAHTPVKRPMYSKTSVKNSETEVVGLLVITSVSKVE